MNYSETGLFIFIENLFKSYYNFPLVQQQCLTIHSLALCCLLIILIVLRNFNFALLLKCVCVCAFLAKNTYTLCTNIQIFMGKYSVKAKTRCLPTTKFRFAWKSSAHNSEFIANADVLIVERCTQIHILAHAHIYIHTYEYLILFSCSSDKCMYVILISFDFSNAHLYWKKKQELAQEFAIVCVFMCVCVWAFLLFIVWNA